MQGDFFTPIPPSSFAFLHIFTQSSFAFLQTNLTIDSFTQHYSINNKIQFTP